MNWCVLMPSIWSFLKTSVIDELMCVDAQYLITSQN